MPALFKIIFYCSIIVLAQNTLANTQRALLIGVSQYDNLDTKQWLKGPDNDIQLMKKVLTDKGFKTKNITLMNHQYIKPTRQNILNQFNQLIQKTQKNDFVFIYFSGHGARQRSLDSTSDEPDGQDEVILPSDADNWIEESSAKIKNAIIDNELKIYFDQLLAKKAFVWFVADSCHSGDLSRSLSLPKTRTIEFNKIISKKINTNMIAFYAAHAAKKAKEKEYGGFLGFGKKTQSVFTYHLVKALKKQPQTLSYQALKNNIFEHYEENIPKPMIVSSNKQVLQCKIFKACHKQKQLINFFHLPIALSGIKKESSVHCLIKHLNKQVPALHITNKSQAKLILSLEDNVLVLTPKLPYFAQQRIDLNGYQNDIKQALFKYLMRFSKINALFTFFENKINNNNKNIQFSVFISNKNKSSIFLKKNRKNILHYQDKININISNKSDNNRDITLLLIDSQYRFTHYFPAKNQGNRIGAMNEVNLSGRVSNETLGSEILLLFSFANKENKDIQDMRFLIEDNIPLLKFTPHVKNITFNHFLLKEGVSKQALKTVSLDYMNWQVWL